MTPKEHLDQTVSFVCKKLNLPEPTEAEKRLCGLQATILEAMTDLEENEPDLAWKRLHQALQEVA